MQILQSFKILFYRKRKKANSKGYVPIYCRVTIDGLNDEISTGIRVLNDQWDDETKQVLSINPFYKASNKKLGQMETDLARHFDLVVAKNGLATPAQVFESYKTPMDGSQQKTEKKENAAFGIELDDVIKSYIRYNRQVESLQSLAFVQQARKDKLEEESCLLRERVSALIKRGRKIFDNKSWTKTLLLATDEFLLNFLELVMADHRATNTLKKKWGTKRRMQEFMQLRYKTEDIPLSKLEYKFITEFVKNERVIYKSGDNTVWKYAQIIKEIMDRAIDNGWIVNNVFSRFECKYTEPDDKSWPTMDEMIRLINFKFDDTDKELSDIRYIFIYQSFAGPSYAELYALKECHLVKGIDGKTWVDQNRRKSASKETLPLLPVCLEIIERFKDHPRCLRTGKLLPVPTDQYYNRCLKEIGEMIDIPCLNNCHQARYFFANEVAYASDVDLKMIGILMGQKNPNSVHTYVKPGKKLISESMRSVENNLYGKNGVLTERQRSVAKVIRLSNRKLNAPFTNISEDW